MAETTNGPGIITDNKKIEAIANAMKDDVAFAREIHQHTIPHWSTAWPRINDLHRKGLVRVTVLNRWMAEVEMVAPNV